MPQRPVEAGPRRPQHERLPYTSLLALLCSLTCPLPLCVLAWLWLAEVTMALVTMDNWAISGAQLLQWNSYGCQGGTELTWGYGETHTRGRAHTCRNKCTHMHTWIAHVCTHTHSKHTQVCAHTVNTHAYPTTGHTCTHLCTHAHGPHTYMYMPTHHTHVHTHITHRVIRVL